MRVLQHCQIVWQNNVNAFWNLVFYEECLSITPLLINHPLQILYLIAGAECIVQPAASRKHSRIWGRQRYLAPGLQNVELQCFWTNFSSVAAESRSARLFMLQGLQTIKTDPLLGTLTSGEALQQPWGGWQPCSSLSHFACCIRLRWVAFLVLFLPKLCKFSGLSTCHIWASSTACCAIIA